jgi:hypothetical protein
MGELSNRCLECSHQYVANNRGSDKRAAGDQRFYSVAWTNGQVWSYKGYDGQSLAVTGRLYFNISGFPMIDGGSWILARSSNSVAGGIVWVPDH